MRHFEAMKYPHLASLLGSALLVLFGPSAPAGELDGLVVQGRMKQIIGGFSTYGHPCPGDTFEIDLAHLPKGKIDLARPDFDPNRDVYPYIPLEGELIIEKVDVGQKDIGGSVVRLTTDTAANRTGGHLIVQVWADELKKGRKVRIYFLESSPDRIGCMAEAEGVLK
jgi:hypothetical protein